MVTTRPLPQRVNPLVRGARRAWRMVRNDCRGFVESLGQIREPVPGLYTYRVTPPGGTRRLHLRIEADGAGTLFIDAMDVVHLNRTAAQFAKFALDGHSLERARLHFGRRCRSVSSAQIAAESERIYRFIAQLSTATTGCPTCAEPDLRRRDLFSIKVSAPYKADLAITYGCNNSCSHCYNEAERLTMPSLLKADWFRVLDKLAAVGVPHIIFTGGEATLHPDLPEIIHHADELGQITGLNTNGRRIAYRPYMQTLADAGLNHLQVTLASHIPAVHDAINGATAFHQTVRGIENALAGNVHAITNTTLMQANVGHVEKLIEFLHRLGIRTFAMNGMIYSGGGFRDPNAIPENEMAPLLILIRDMAVDLGMRFLWYTPTEYCRMSPVELEIGAKRCNAGEYSLCVEPNGDVLPCQSYYAAAGNLLRDPWEKIWHGELFRSFRDREKDPRAAGLPEMCWECPDLPLCGGGCRIEREARDGRRTAIVSESTEESCAGGCSGCGTAGRASSHAEVGFVPTGNLVDAAVRSTGRGVSVLPILTTAVAEQSRTGSCGSSCGCSHGAKPDTSAGSSNLPLLHTISLDGSFVFKEPGE